MDVLSVIMRMKRKNTYFFIVILPEQCGLRVPYNLRSTDTHGDQRVPCLIRKRHDTQRIRRDMHGIRIRVNGYGQSQKDTRI
ncbi:unnamed protein product [Prunus armeniaca]